MIKPKFIEYSCKGDSSGCHLFESKGGGLYKSIGVDLMIDDAFEKIQMLKADNERLQELADKQRILIDGHIDKLEKCYAVRLESVSEEKTFGLWMEGFAASGSYGKAEYIGRFKGKDFNDACNNWITAPDCTYETANYSSDNRTYWGCRLFEREADARAAFG